MANAVTHGGTGAPSLRTDIANLLAGNTTSWSSGTNHKLKLYTGTMPTNAYTALSGNTAAATLTAIAWNKASFVVPTTSGFSVAATTGGSLAAGTYLVAYTLVNLSGESLMSGTQSATVSASGKINVTLPALPTNAVSMSLYASTVGGGVGTMTVQATGITTTSASISSIAAGASPPTSAGQVTISASTADSNAVGGTVTFFRLYRTAAVDPDDVILQGTVGTSGTDLIINNTTISAGASVSLTGTNSYTPSP